MELFYSAYKSAISQQIFFFELMKALYSFAFNLLNSKQTKQKASCTFPFLFLFACMHKVGLIL